MASPVLPVAEPAQVERESDVSSLGLPSAGRGDGMTVVARRSA